MNIADVLSGSAGLDGIQWLLVSGEPYKAFLRELCELLPEPARLASCHLRRVRFKPGRKLIAHYDAHIRVGSNGDECVRPIALTWGTHRDGEGRHAWAELGELENEAVRRGVAAPFRRLAADSKSLRLHVRVSPLDARFPQLVRLCDPAYVREVIAKASAKCDAAPVQFASDRYSITFVRYRPGQRHLLRYDPLDKRASAVIFAKLYPREKGEQAFHVANQIGDWLERRFEGVKSVRPLEYVAEDSALLCPHVLGMPLSELLQRPGPHLAKTLKSAGAALNALHQLPQAGTGPLGLHDFAAEIEEIAKTSAHITALLPQLGAALGALLDRAREMHQRLPLEPPAFTHGDFKAEHVWSSSAGLHLMDFDSCCLGDPALDVGKFLADLQVWFAFCGRQGLQEAQQQFLAGYKMGAPAERLIRARLYEVIELVKQTLCHARMFEQNWASQTDWSIRRAQVLLSDFELALGLPAREALTLPSSQFVSEPLR